MKKIITLFAFCAILCACDKDKYSLDYYSQDIGNIGEETEWEPKANFDVTSNSNCVIIIYDLSVGVKMTYNFGDGCVEDYYPKEGTIKLSGSERKITHTYTKKKTYTVTVTAYNNKGKSATYSKDIIVR